MSKCIIQGLWIAVTYWTFHNHDVTFADRLDPPTPSVGESVKLVWNVTECDGTFWHNTATIGIYNKSRALSIFNDSRITQENPSLLERGFSIDNLTKEDSGKYSFICHSDQRPRIITLFVYWKPETPVCKKIASRTIKCLILQPSDHQYDWMWYEAGEEIQSADSDSLVVNSTTDAVFTCRVKLRGSSLVSDSCLGVTVLRRDIWFLPITAPICGLIVLFLVTVAVLVSRRRLCFQRPKRLEQAINASTYTRRSSAEHTICIRNDCTRGRGTLQSTYNVYEIVAYEDMRELPDTQAGRLHLDGVVCNQLHSAYNTTDIVNPNYVPDCTPRDPNWYKQTTQASAPDISHTMFVENDKYE